MFFLSLPVQVGDGVDMGALVERAMQRAGVTHKQMWLAQGYPNASQWSKAIDGSAPLDLWRLRNCPIEFWFFLVQELIRAKAADFWRDLAPATVLKAELPQDASERKAS